MDDNFQADLSFGGCRVHLHTREIKIGAKQVDGTILEGDAEDVAREFLGRHEAMSSGPRNVVRGYCCHLSSTKS